jgi:nucleoside-diphosphate-sugar epimerase
MRTVLLTGSAGFIGARTADFLLKKGFRVVGVDNLNSYYDPALKTFRLKELKKNRAFKFYKADIENLQPLRNIFKAAKPDAVINLAARAGVRYSLVDPFVYLRTNTLGTLNLLELCKEREVKKFVLASTSSLYASETMPFKETFAVNTPLSPYAATKKGAEALCYAYYHLYGIDTTIFRYFTVYGPAGRPDMSYFIFMQKIDQGQTIPVYGDGNHLRDFTFVDDIATGTVLGLKKVGYQTFNLGGNQCYRLIEMIRLIEKVMGKKARIKFYPAHKADLRATKADAGQAKRVLGWTAKIGLLEGLQKTADWYRANRQWVNKLHPLQA